MFEIQRKRAVAACLAPALALSLLAGCATTGTRDDAPRREPYVTKRDRTLKGAGVGAAAGAVGAVLAGKREADEILAGAAIGAVVGGGVGAYMDRQQEKLARIPGTTVERVGDDTLLLHFDSDVLFDVNSAVIDSSGRSTLEDVAGVLDEYDKTAVVIQGHTDATGSEEHNQELSERRATSVRNYLVGRGVDDDRLSAVGFGEGYPVASNDSESGRQQNRRVDILLKAKAGPVRG
ncbi:MAG TPA: OmpA family protein [Thermoanaerobaculia bacterium]|nr:OmpA family protein [Thermoanaerobaculia bacterium]